MRRRHSPRRRAGGTGQALAEFALVIPIFVLMLLGIIETGRFIFNYEVLNNATREGARYAIVHGDNAFCPSGPPPPGHTNACDPSGSRVLQRVRDTAYAIPPSQVASTASWDPNNRRGNTVTVTATYTYATVVPLLPLPPITVHAESTLVINN